ncbi:hypothetical protein C8R42DRAFT_716355 [Lentinula raphanica]|nr:hypothetical protein C8R42DRAFT_716355 [Lentinula raphanica]
MSFYNPQTGRVDIPPPIKTRPKNPLRNPSFDGQRTESLSTDDDLSNSDSNVTAFSEVEKIISRDDKMSLRKLLRTDRREFITGTSNTMMQAVHVVNAIRISGRKKETKKKMKSLIEELLTHFWFNNGNPFELDSRPNMILLSNNNHSALDLYGLIGLSPGEDRLQKIIKQLQFDNAHWTLRVHRGEDSGRNLDVCIKLVMNYPCPNPKLHQMNQDPYNVNSIQWEVVVLHRDDFIPPGEHLLAVRPSKRNLHGQLADGASTLCHITGRSDDEAQTKLPLLCDSNGAPLRFNMQTKRDPTQKLSLFAMLVNLHSKLQACTRTVSSSDAVRIHVLHSQVEIAVSLIFYEPFGLKLREKIHDEALKQRSASTMGTDSSFSSMSFAPNTQHTPSAGHSFPDSEMSAGDNNRDDDEILDERGLTEKEVNILMDNITSGRSAGAKRVQDIQMLLFGARGMFSSSCLFESVALIHQYTGYPQFRQPMRAATLDSDSDSDSDEGSE